MFAFIEYFMGYRYKRLRYKSTIKKELHLNQQKQ